MLRDLGEQPVDQPPLQVSREFSKRNGDLLETSETQLAVRFKACHKLNAWSHSYENVDEEALPKIKSSNNDFGGGNMTNLVVHWTSRNRQFRDTVTAASGFGKRNQLPSQIQDQILSHACLNFKTESLEQQETVNGLLKAIRASITCYLFLPIVQNLGLFQGVSNDFIFQLKVPEMEAEYYPPREDVML